MARNVFYSFCYSDDINRTMVVRNRWVTQGTQTNSGIIDKAEFEKIKKKGNKAVYDWIDEQLEGTSATAVLLGTNTLTRPFVQYEISESKRRGNAIIGIHINRIRDMQTGMISRRCNEHTFIGENVNDYFDNICDCIYDYILDDGYNSLGRWVERAVSSKK